MHIYKSSLENIERPLIGKRKQRYASFTSYIFYTKHMCLFIRCRYLSHMRAVKGSGEHAHQRSLTHQSLCCSHIHRKKNNANSCIKSVIKYAQMSREMWFQTMWHFDKRRLRRALQPPFRLRNSKWCSVSSLTFIEYSSDKQRLWSVCAYAQADLRLCWSHIPHCWKSHIAAQMVT